MKKLILSASLILTLALTGCGESDSSKPKETVKKASLEEQSKQFIDENLEGKTIADFTNKLLTVKDEKLVYMIILGHKNGKQFEDDFDLLGRTATASGVITEYGQ